MGIHISGFNDLKEYKVGEKVCITDTKSTYYGQTGVIDSKGDIGGYWIKHSDGKVVYHPWGYEKVLKGDMK